MTGDDARAARRELLRRRRATAGGSPAPAAASPAAPAPSGPGTAGLGVAERRMWKIHRLDTASVSHNITLLLECRGVTAEHLVAGVEAVVSGAVVLGSVIVDDDDDTTGAAPHRVPRGASGRWYVQGRRWGLGTPDPTDTPDPTGPARAGSTAADMAAILARTPFDLTRELPVRAWVDGSTLVLSVHHLAVDDTSWPLLLGSILAGRWQGQVQDPVEVATPEAGPDRVERAVAHARATWAAEGIRFPLSGALPETTPEQSWLAPLDEAPGAQLRRDLASADLAAFAAFAPTVGATANAALVALCAVSVSVVTGVTDHVLVVPADNRRPGQSPDRVGYCGNIVPIRFTFDPAGSVEQAMRDAVSAIYAAMEFADVDFGPVLTALRRDGGRFPVVEIMASVRPAPMRHIRPPAGVDVDYQSVTTGIAPYPVTLAIELAAPGRAHLEVDVQHGTGVPVAEHAAAVVADLLHRIPGAAGTPLSSLIDELSLSHSDSEAPREQQR